MRTIPTILTCCVSFALGLAAGEVASSKNQEFECATKTCTQIASCEEAMFLLKECGLKKLDRDGDGTPCETLCKEGATNPMEQTKAAQRKQMVEEILNEARLILNEKLNDN